MTETGTMLIDITDVTVQPRLRPNSAAHVEMLATSIGERGQISPIEVSLQNGVYVLVAGAHRLAAVSRLGWPQIAAVVRGSMDPTEARMREIDENLIRHTLNPLDRAIFLAARKGIYEEQHPETKAGVAGGKARQGSASDTMSFARDVAEKTDLGKRTIERAISIAEGIPPALREQLAGSDTANSQNELLALAKLEPKVQKKAVAALLRPEAPARTVKAARDEIEGRTVSTDPHELQLKALRQAWNKASTKAQKVFLDGLREAGETD